MVKRINSRNKGKVGELEVAKILREKGWAARRGQQFSGGNESPDVVSELPYHIEVKRVEKFDLYGALEQADRDSEGTDKESLVIHRKNGKEWVAVVRLEEFLRLVDKAILNEL